jgi:FkbM family methyltransferase
VEPFQLLRRFYQYTVPEEVREPIAKARGPIQAWVLTGPVGLIRLRMALAENKVATEKYTVFLNSSDQMARDLFYFHLSSGGAPFVEVFEMAAFGACIEDNPGCVVVDIGASYGGYTLEACSLMSTTHIQRIVAIEPHSPSYSCLAESLKRSGFESRVDLVNPAIADLPDARIGFRQGGKYRLTPCFGGSKIALGSDRDDEVPCTTLDALLSDLDIEKTATFIIKIDIEGFEPRAFTGMEVLLDKAAGYQIFMEFSPILLRQAGSDPHVFVRRLLDLETDGIWEIDDNRQCFCRLEKISHFSRMIDRLESTVPTNLFISKNVGIPDFVRNRIA